MTYQKNFLELKKNEGKINLNEYYISFKYKIFFYLIVLIIDFYRFKVTFFMEKNSMFNDINLIYVFLKSIGILK